MQVLCLDFDDTIYIHEHIPEMFDVYEMVQGFMDPLVLNDMLSAGAPHRYVRTGPLGHETGYFLLVHFVH